LVDQLHPVAEARQITLRGEWEDTLVVEGDAGWLERLLLNLMDNAIKFTHPGGEVVVRVRPDRSTVRLEVSDTGIGMTPDVVARVFERFYRADPARSSTGSGSGLGLTLVAWIVDRHGGSVVVHSEPGRGSTFVVTLPRPMAVSDEPVEHDTEIAGAGAGANGADFSRH
jgi:two-component system OmpR family sensor kinase